MNEKYYIKSDFKQQLESLNSGTLDTITVYKVENGKVYFKANRHRLHLEQAEFDDVIIKN